MKFITSRALILGIQAVVSAVLAFFVVKIGILPTKYLMAAFAVLVVLWLLMLLFTKPSKKNKVGRPLVGKIVSLVLSIAMVFGTSKIIKGDSFLSSLTNVGTETTTYSLIVLKSSGYKTVSSLKGKTIDYYTNDKKKAMEVKDELQKQIKFHGNGEEGIRKAMKYVPDLIISDVMMPGIDGVECCRRLKSELQTCHIPVILLTACSLDEQRIQGYDGGADSYISKPFSSQLLLARVRNLIDSHRRLKQFFGDGQALAKEDVCDMDKEFVEKFKALIDEKMGDSGLNVEDLGKDMGLSRVQLYRKIKSLTNYSPNELLRIARLKKAASLLASSDMTVSEIGYEVGFSSPSYFAKCYKELFGESPTDLLKRKG